MKIVGICSIGTYYSPWFPYTLASIYNVCDEIVVTNFGYDISDPRLHTLVPLQQVSDDIQHLDLDLKVHEFVEPDYNNMITKAPLMTEREAMLKMAKFWYDLRGLSLTKANEEALKLGADWILKIDSDEALYPDIAHIREHLNNDINGYKFYQYELTGEIGKDLPVYRTDPPPDSPYNDSSFIYKTMPGQWYAGGAAPCLNLIGHDRIDSDIAHCAHLRYANSAYLTEDAKFKHFYERTWFRLYTNQYGRFCDELNAQAKKEAEDFMQYANKKLIDIKAPDVLMYKDPLEYIEGE
jgi:hypothetical protein